MGTGIGNSKGTFVISLDTELAWGSVDKPKSLRTNRRYYARTRYVIEEILKLLVKYEISATWAVVGHLFLDRCSEDISGKHTDVPRSPHPWYDSDWFSADPCTNLEQDPFWYGRDIVERLLDCPVYQEIASHSFSHAIFDDRGLKRETALAEIAKSLEVAGQANVKIKSFVFPRNSVGFVEELPGFGITSFRGPDMAWYNDYPILLRKAFHIIDQAFSLCPPVHSPTDVGGVLNIPASMLYLSRDGFRKLIPISARVKKAKKGTRRAIERGKVFHLWFHPFNIATDPDNLLAGLEEIFQEVDKGRKNGCLSIRTMSQIATEFYGLPRE